MGKLALTLSAANIKYLLVIHELDHSGSGVHSIDVAEKLSVSKPSTHKMLNALKKRQLISKDSYGVVLFTKLGKQLAARYQACFDILYLHFFKLLPQNADVKAVTCAFLAEVPIDDVESMCRKLNKERHITCIVT